ncbi:MAG: TM2 domain-containing protein [Alphaproteobacteria bacterium]|nr:TM2 domain-containing protein [Alphaproteobacteria bacterium]
MRGQVLGYSPESGDGVISGADGKRYTFKGTEFHGGVLTIRPGMEVDFESHEDGTATSVYPLPGQVGADAGGKSKIAAGLLAIFLGALGIHKFYLGYTGPGIIMLLCGTIGWLLILPGLITCLIAFIEGIIYLTKTDAEFDELYVKNKRAWF